MVKLVEMRDRKGRGKRVKDIARSALALDKRQILHKADKGLRRGRRGRALFQASPPLKIIKPKPLAKEKYSTYVISVHTSQF
jgi:hypothetical protein